MWGRGVGVGFVTPERGAEMPVMEGVEGHRSPSWGCKGGYNAIHGHGHNILKERMYIAGARLLTNYV